MERLRFETEATVVPPAPNRADIALFVGFVDRRATALPSPIANWLFERRWRTSAGTTTVDVGNHDPLTDVPVPIDAWDVFDHLFAWDRRSISGSSETATSYLGAAVRSYFLQGGRKCYVVRVGDTWPLLERTPDAEAFRARRTTRLRKLVPGYADPVQTDVVDKREWSDPAGEPESWHGLGHLNGLPDVSILCLPDLADIVSAPQAPLSVEKDSPPQNVDWSECSGPQPAPVVDHPVQFLPAPRCNEEGYTRWSAAVSLSAEFLARYAREVQLVSAVPLRLGDGGQVPDPIRNLLDGTGAEAGVPQDQNGLASAFLQLTYPWVRTAGSSRLPEQLESPDGVLAGVLARNALTRGAFRTIAGLDLGDVYDAQPLLHESELRTRQAKSSGLVESGPSFVDRVSLLGPTPDGWQVLSDVTTSCSESYRPAALGRLCTMLIREARQFGEQVVFERNAERQWARVRDHFRKVLAGLLRAGALRGARPEDAFDVRCDRSTMTRNDIDSGRIVAQIQFDGAPPIERITVVLAMDEGGSVSLAAAKRQEQEAA